MGRLCWEQGSAAPQLGSCSQAAPWLFVRALGCECGCIAWCLRVSASCSHGGVLGRSEAGGLGSSTGSMKLRSVCALLG